MARGPSGNQRHRTRMQRTDLLHTSGSVVSPAGCCRCCHEASVAAHRADVLSAISMAVFRVVLAVAVLAAPFAAAQATTTSSTSSIMSGASAVLCIIAVDMKSFVMSHVASELPAVNYY